MNDQTAEKVYQVDMGHCSTQVTSDSEAGAIAKARDHFMRELPRLWDVISQLEPSKFRVTIL